VCKVSGRTAWGRVLTRKYPSGRPGKKTDLCRRMWEWRCVVVARDGCERAGCFKPGPLYNPPPPEERPPVGIEWEVGCAPEADWTVGLSRGAWCMQIRTVDWNWALQLELVTFLQQAVKCRYLHNCCWGCESDNVGGRHSGLGCRARG
jgi:hypothetical protein